MLPPRAWLAVALVVGLGAGCASSVVRPEVLQGWVGRPAAALRQEWGLPTREIPDGARRILVYEQLEKRSGSDFQSTPSSARQSGLSPAQALANEIYRNPTVYVRSYLFWVDAQDAIVHVDIRQP